MKLKSILLLLFLAVAMMGSAQDQQPLRKRTRERLDKAWIGDSTAIKIKYQRSICEEQIRLLKRKELESEELKALYAEAKEAYDMVLDQMIDDISKTATIGEFVAYFGGSSTRKVEYNKLLKLAETKSISFLNASTLAMEDETFASGIFFNVLYNVFIDALIPDFVQQLTEGLRDSIKEYYIKRINSLRFDEWRKIN